MTGTEAHRNSGCGLRVFFCPDTSSIVRFIIVQTSGTSQLYMETPWHNGHNPSSLLQYISNARWLNSYCLSYINGYRFSFLEVCGKFIQTFLFLVETTAVFLFESTKHTLNCNPNGRFSLSKTPERCLTCISVLPFVRSDGNRIWTLAADSTFDANIFSKPYKQKPTTKCVLQQLSISIIGLTKGYHWCDKRLHQWQSWLTRSKVRSLRFAKMAVLNEYTMHRLSRD